MPSLFTKLNVPFSTPTLNGLLMVHTWAGVRFANAVHVSTAAHQELDQVNGTTADGTEQRCLAGLVPDIQQVWALLEDQLRKCVEGGLLHECCQHTTKAVKALQPALQRFNLLSLTG